MFSQSTGVFNRYLSVKLNEKAQAFKKKQSYQMLVQNPSILA